MDLQTENQISEKWEENLWQESEKDVIQDNTLLPKVRTRVNTQFLTAFLLKVQQANHTANVHEIRHAKKKGSVLRRMKKGRVVNHKSGCRVASVASDCDDSGIHASREMYCGMTDEEIEGFLLSRVKRCRGNIGSRMKKRDSSPNSHKSNDTEDGKCCSTEEHLDSRVKLHGEAVVRHSTLCPEAKRMRVHLLSNAVEAWRLGVFGSAGHHF